MSGNFTSRTITGGAMILIGLVLIALSLFIPVASISLIYGIPILIIGAIIFFNKKEDKIEQIKRRRK